MTHMFKNEVPLFTRCIIIILISTTCFSLILQNNLFNVDQKAIINQFEIYRIFTNWMHEGNFIVFCMILHDMFRLMALFETRNSTVVLAVQFFAYQLFWTFVFTLGIVALHFLAEIQISWQFTTLCYWINFLYKFSYESPDKGKITMFLFWGQVLLTAYPFIIYILCCIASWSIRVDGIIGLMSAIIECKFFNSGLILFTKETYTEKQEYGDKLCLTKLDCWVTVNKVAIELNERYTVSTSQFFKKCFADEESNCNEVNHEKGIKIEQSEQKFEQSD